MASVRLRTGSLPFLFAVILGIFFCLSTPVSASNSLPSPRAESKLIIHPNPPPEPPQEKPDWICHTSNIEECYPRVFRPTEEFQVVRRDQELPKGLHVRWNIWTEQMEAKINVPDEADPELKGLPVDRAVVVVEPEQPDGPPIPKEAPKYDPIGKVKEPQTDAGAFAVAFKALKTGFSEREDFFDLDSALTDLEELSHDVYYGLKISEDADVVKALFCLMGQEDADRMSEGLEPRDYLAVVILAGALSNNPSALKEVEKIWRGLMDSRCPQDGTPLRQLFYSNYVVPPPGRQQKTECVYPARTHTSPATVRAQVSAINGLLKSKTIRDDFLNNGGMKWLLEIFIQENKNWAGAQRKVGHLVLDTFLDEDFGAELGQWPNKPRLSNEECESAELSLEEGCWDYHVERMMEANKDDKTHWSRELHHKLVAARKAEKAPPAHEEL